MLNKVQIADESEAGELLLERLAEALSIDTATFYEATPLMPVRETPAGLNGHRPMELALFQALDRVDDPGLRDHLERLLRTLEAKR